MRIISCITDISEIEKIKSLNVDEVYFGVDHKYIPNFANSGNIKTIREAKEIIDLAHKYKIKVNLAANSISNEDYEKILLNIKKIISYNIDGIIISSYGLLNRLKRLSIPIHLSSVNPVFNSDHLKFLIKNFKISRLILPAQLSYHQSREIIRIANENNIEIEIFFFKFFGCPYINATCYLHQDEYIKPPTIEGNQCNLKDKVLSIENIDSNQTDEIKKIMARIVFRMSCSNFPRIFNAASFFDFYTAGVKYVKYGTRTDDTQTKIKKIKFINFTLKYIKSLINKYGPDKAKEIFAITIDDLGRDIWKKQ